MMVRRTIVARANDEVYGVREGRRKSIRSESVNLTPGIAHAWAEEEAVPTFIDVFRLLAEMMRRDFPSAKNDCTSAEVTVI